VIQTTENESPMRFVMRLNQYRLAEMRLRNERRASFLKQGLTEDQIDEIPGMLSPGTREHLDKLNEEGKLCAPGHPALLDTVCGSCGFIA
jgi:hypothetical protein